jgi:hypothetical protein
MSDSIDSVIVGGKRSVSTEGTIDGESHWQHRQRQGQCLGWRCCFGVQRVQLQGSGRAGQAGWLGVRVVKIARDRQVDEVRREQARAGSGWGIPILIAAPFWPTS